MSASIERFISPRFGGTTFPSTDETGPFPSGAFSSATHCFMMRTDCRISSMRTRYAPQRRRQRDDIERRGGDIEKMIENAPNLAIEAADQLTPARHRDAEQLLDGERERMLLVHRRDIIEPVEIRNRLKISLVLDQLL